MLNRILNSLNTVMCMYLCVDYLFISHNDTAIILSHNDTAIILAGIFLVLIQLERLERKLVRDFPNATWTRSNTNDETKV